MNRRPAKALFALTAVVATAVAGTIGANPAWATVTCPPDIVDTTVNDSVVVPPGATCVIFNSTVTGNVTVGTNASVTLVGATVQGNFVTNGAHDIRVGNCLEFGCAVSRPTVVNGNVSIQGTSGVPSFPTKNVICDASFTGGNVVLQNNTAPFAIGVDPECNFGGGNRIRGSLVLYGNTAPITVTGNQISGYLQCAGNSPAPINGGGNTVAGGKFGQCAAF
jgi:hexosaminidase